MTNTKEVQRWYNGPDFLWQPKESWSLERDSCRSLDESNPEIKHEVKVNFTRTISSSVWTWLEKRISDWTRMKRIIGIVLKFEQILNQKLSLPSDILKNEHSAVVDINLLGRTSIKIIKMPQQREFLKKLRIIKKANKQNPAVVIRVLRQRQAQFMVLTCF